MQFCRGQADLSETGLDFSWFWWVCIDDGVSVWDLGKGLKFCSIAFQGVFKQFDPNFVESSIDFEVAHLSILMFWRLPYLEIPIFGIVELQRSWKSRSIPNWNSPMCHSNFTSVNRSWDEELQETIRELQVHLEQECDNYFTTKIKQQTLKVGKRQPHPNTPRREGSEAG